MPMPFKLKITDKAGAKIFETDVADIAARQIEAALSKEAPKEQRRILRDVRQQLADQKAAERAALDAAMNKHITEVDSLQAQIKAKEDAIAVIREFNGWTGEDGTGRLERATGSRAHILQTAIENDRIVMWSTVGRDDAKDSSRAVLSHVDEPLPIGQVFVVEHDWDAAFAGAEDFDDVRREFHLPYENVCFEFQVSGKHICALAQNAHAADRDVFVAAFVELKTSFPGAWLYVAADEKPWIPVLKLIGRQIKAICVALEAEVATTEIVRAPHRLNHARERAGKLPIYDHHVVKLARRSRPAPLAAGDHQPGAKKRLHFRRGHWRHYDNHKTWIKWMLVGDPDIGFVDKEYRL